MWQIQGPWSDSKCSKQWKSDVHVKSLNPVRARSPLTKSKRKNNTKCSNVKASVSVHWCMLYNIFYIPYLFCLCSMPWMIYNIQKCYISCDVRCIKGMLTAYIVILWYIVLQRTCLCWRWPVIFMLYTMNYLVILLTYIACFEFYNWIGGMLYTPHFMLYSKGSNTYEYNINVCYVMHHDDPTFQMDWESWQLRWRTSSMTREAAERLPSSHGQRLIARYRQAYSMTL